MGTRISRLVYNWRRQFMKKLAIGCGLIVLLVGAGIIGVGYYGYLKVRSTVNQFAELRQVPDIERGIKIQTPFAPPASGELTEKQVERLMLVQRRVHERLGQDFAAMERNYKSLMDKKEATVTDLPALVSAYKDMAASWMSAKREQVQALNDAGLSLSEYRWIRLQSYRAIGVPFVDMDFGRLAEQATSSKPAEVMGNFGPSTGPDAAANLKIVERYRKDLERYVPLAAFGL
jgi:hypothetical protein